MYRELCKQAEDGQQSIPELWSNNRRIRPHLLLWPSEAVKFRGQLTEDVLPFDMPGDRSEWPELLLDRVLDSKACALLLVEQREQAVVAIFESPRGTTSWHYPIKDHGDLKILGPPVKKTDVESVGLLWRPKQAVS